MSNTPDARRAFEAIALILSSRGDGIKVKVKEVKQKKTTAAKAS